MSLRSPVPKFRSTSRFRHFPALIRTLSQSSNELAGETAPEKALCPVTAKKILMGLSDQLVEIAADGTVTEPRSFAKNLGISEHFSGNFERVIEQETSRKQFWQVTRLSTSTGMPQRWNGVLGEYVCEALVLDTNQCKQRAESFNKSTHFLVGIRRTDSTEQVRRPQASAEEELSVVSPFASDANKEATPPRVSMSLVQTTASLDEKLAAAKQHGRIHEPQEQLPKNSNLGACDLPWADLGSFSKLSASVCSPDGTFSADAGSQAASPRRVEAASPRRVEAEIQTDELLVCHRCQSASQGDNDESFASSGARSHQGDNDESFVSSGARSHQDIRPPQLPKEQGGQRPRFRGRSTRPASPQRMVDTPADSRYGSVVMAMLHWQIHDKGGACCRWHAAVPMLVGIARQMVASHCKHDFRPLQGWQCKGCLCVNLRKGLLCDVCGARPPRGAL